MLHLWLLGLLISTSTTPDLGPQLTQLGIGALVAVPAWGACWKLWQAWQSSQAELKTLQLERVQDAKDAITRERELADRLGPLLAEAAKVLSTAPERFDQALGQVQASTRNSEVDGMMRRLESFVARLPQERGR